MNCPSTIKYSRYQENGGFITGLCDSSKQEAALNRKTGTGVSGWLIA
jgi:hypothetical protein